MNKDGSSVSRVDCYDPAANTWTLLADMKIPRRGHTLINLQNKLYAIGGTCFSHDCDHPHFDEVYDSQLNRWSLLPTKMGSLSVGATLIKKYYVVNEK